MSGGRERLVELARAKPIPPYSLDEELTFFCPRENLTGLNLPAVRAFHRWLLHEHQPSPTLEPSVLLLLPGQKVKPCTLSDEHRAINGMLLAAGFRPLDRGDCRRRWPTSPPRSCCPTPRWPGTACGSTARWCPSRSGWSPTRPSTNGAAGRLPAPATTTPACSSTAASPAPGGRTAPWSGPQGPGAGATPSGRRSWRSTTGSARCWPRCWSAGGTTTPRCSAMSLPGSPTARSSGDAAERRAAGLPTGRRVGGRLLRLRGVGELAPGLVTLVPDGRELAALRRDQGGHLPADVLTRAWCLRLLLDRLGQVADAATSTPR